MPKPTKPIEVPTSHTRFVDDLHPDDESVEYADVTKDAVDETEPKDVTAERETDKSIPVSEDAELPEELRGKTPAQLAKMYKEAQSVIGRQGTELGDLRKTADLAIRLTSSQRERPAPAKEEPVAKPMDDVDFFTDPKGAVARMIAEHPRLKELTGQAQTSAAREMARERAANQAKFNELHPDAAEILVNPEFREWVGKSKIRQDLLLRAHQSYDVDAGHEVLSTWKALHPKPAEPTAEGKAAAAAKAKIARSAASVPSGGNATQKETGKGGKPIFRRSQVLQMMEKDPKRYEAMAEEIAAAYADNRVR